MMNVEKRMQLLKKIEEIRLKDEEIAAMEVVLFGDVENYIDYASKRLEDAVIEHLDRSREFLKRKNEYDIFVKVVENVAIMATEGAHRRKRPFICHAIRQNIVYGMPLSKSEGVTPETARRYRSIAWELLAEQYL